MFDFLSIKNKFFGTGCHKISNNPSVFIPFDQHSSVGGPTTFLKNLKAYFDRVGFQYVSDIRKGSVILFPISYDLRKLKKFKNRGGRICQRLDGIYYPQKHGDDYIKRNEKIKTIYSALADHIIFQSEYSRAQCFDMFGPVPESDYSIVTNGVNTEIFYPDVDRIFDRTDVHFCTTGNFRNADMLVPVIQALDSLHGDIDFVLHVVGPIRNEDCAAVMSRKYIVHHDRCSMDEVSDILRKSDIFIYSHLNPPCPNSILEAIASGLPIVGYNSGAMEELLPFSTVLLADAGGKLYNQIEDFKPEFLAEKLLYSVEHFDVCREISLEVSTTYSMDNCGRKYGGVITRELAKCIPNEG
jgi:glycosyltransferase involved in cell wall biosynthesis